VIGKLFQSASVADHACRRAPRLTSNGMVASIRAGPACRPMASAAAMPAMAAAAPSIAGAQRRCTVASNTPWTTMPASAATSPPREAVKVSPANRVSQMSAGGASDSTRRSSASWARARRVAHQPQAKVSARAISRYTARWFGLKKVPRSREAAIGTSTPHSVRSPALALRAPKKTWTRAAATIAPPSQRRRWRRRPAAAPASRQAAVDAQVRAAARVAAGATLSRAGPAAAVPTSAATWSCRRACPGDSRETTASGQGSACTKPSRATAASAAAGSATGRRSPGRSITAIARARAQNARTCNVASPQVVTPPKGSGAQSSSAASSAVSAVPE
jgi:hypothetical protein